MSTLSSIIFKGTDAFDEGDGEQVLVKDGAKGNYVHIRIQQRNGRKSLTTVQGLATDLDLKKILKALKKTYSTNGTILVDEELGEIIQLQAPEVKPIRFLCFDLSRLSKPILFALLSAGVVGFFILNSFLEEFLFKALKNFKFGWYMTAFELMCFTGFAVLERYARGSEPIWSHTAKYRHHLLVAFCMTLSRGLTNKSLEYLNYPTQVIFKSLKLITVMIGSIFMLQQRFSAVEYVSAAALVASAILFSLGDVAETPEFGGYMGFTIVCLSLVADAMHSNTQEQLLKKYNASVTEAMLYTNGFAAIMSWIWVIVTGEFAPAYNYCSDFPLAYILFVMRAAVIYLGVLCFVLTISTFGVVKATAVTTVRKILTIVVSFILFPKPISSKHVMGFFIFSLGVSLSIWDAMQRAAAQKAAAALLLQQQAAQQRGGSVQLAQIEA